jgi:hypothetical protein
MPPIDGVARSSRLSNCCQALTGPEKEKARCPFLERALCCLVAAGRLQDVLNIAHALAAACRTNTHRGLCQEHRVLPSAHPAAMAESTT